MVYISVLLLGGPLVVAGSFTWMARKTLTLGKLLPYAEKVQGWIFGTAVYLAAYFVTLNLGTMPDPWNFSSANFLGVDDSCPFGAKKHSLK